MSRFLTALVAVFLCLNVPARAGTCEFNHPIAEVESRLAGIHGAALPAAIRMDGEEGALFLEIVNAMPPATAVTAEYLLIYRVPGFAILMLAMQGDVACNALNLQPSTYDLVLDQMQQRMGPGA